MWVHWDFGCPEARSKIRRLMPTAPPLPPVVFQNRGTLESILQSFGWAWLPFPFMRPGNPYENMTNSLSNPTKAFQQEPTPNP